MKTWWAILALLLAACVAAWGWHALALDPGTVLVRFAGWRVETSFVVGLAVLLLLWGLLSLLWRVARWPRAAFRRRARRRGHERIADGLVALYEGRHARAARELERAAHVRELHAPALLARAQAAHARGDDDAAVAILRDAAQTVPDAARALQARLLLAQGRNAEVLALLGPEANNGTLAPDAWRSLNAAAIAAGDVTTAVATLAPLARDEALGSGLATIEANTLAFALARTADAAQLTKLWSGLSRSQRRIETVVAAYARRAAALGQPLAAMSEIESALRRAWSESLVQAYAELGPAEANARLRQAEGWLAAQPNSAALLLTLGRLCNQCELWGKSREYLERGLAIDASAQMWEAFADACSGQGDAATAGRAYRNALRRSRGEPVESLPALARAALDTRASVVEERSEHGVPRLILPGR
jgi:HemY protein